MARRREGRPEVRSQERKKLKMLILGKKGGGGKREAED